MQRYQDAGQNHCFIHKIR